MKKEQEVVNSDNKILKLIKLYIAVACAISSYFLAFTVKSDMQVILYVVAVGPALTSGYLVYKNWLG